MKQKEVRGVTRHNLENSSALDRLIENISDKTHALHLLHIPEIKESEEPPETFSTGLWYYASLFI